MISLFEENISSQNLSKSLQKKIRANPSFTFPKSFAKEIEKSFEKLPKSKPYRNLDIPDSFDGRVIWKDFLSPVKNQGKCGSCWAFATTSTLADKFNIYSRGLFSLNLSPSKLILCDDSRDKGFTACDGNSLVAPWSYLFKYGTVTESCLPYGNYLKNIEEKTEEKEIPKCSDVFGLNEDECYNAENSPARFYRCLHYYSVAGTSKYGGSEYYIRHNIFAWGPVSTAMIIYPDFYIFDPKKEIYSWNGNGSPVGGHAIEIVGWGIENNRKFWWIKNSWGPKWGINGYFRAERGVNMCELEDNIITGVPDFFYPPTFYMNNANFVWDETPGDEDERLKYFNTTNGQLIDNLTGYSKRLERKNPSLSKVIAYYKVLPAMHTFVAGNVEKGKNTIFYIVAVLAFLLILFLLLRNLKK